MQLVRLRQQLATRFAGEGWQPGNFTVLHMVTGSRAVLPRQKPQRGDPPSGALLTA